MRGLGLTVNRPLYEPGAADVACVVGTMTEDDMALVGTSRAVMLDALAAEIDYVSLHTADPGATGTSEVSGGGYARVGTSWGSATASSLTLASTDFTTPAGTFTHVGFWSAVSGGTFFGSAQIANPKPRGAGTFTLPACRVYLDAGDIYVDQGSSDSFRLVLHNTGLLQAPLRLDPDTVLLLDPASYDDVQRFCPTSHTGWGQDGNGRLTAVGVANGVNASAGPIFAPDQYGNCVTLNQTVGVFPRISAASGQVAPTTGDDFTFELKIAANDFSTAAGRVIASGSDGGTFYQIRLAGDLIQWNDGTTPTAVTTSLPTYGVVSGIPFRVRLRHGTGGSVQCWVSVDDGATWGASAGVVAFGASTDLSACSIVVGSHYGGAGAKFRIHELQVVDGAPGGATIADLPVDPAAYDTLADGGVATDAYDVEWTIERPASDTSAVRVLPSRTERYIGLPGVAGEYVSTPDTAANSITGDIAIKAKLRPESWTPTAQGTIAAKWGASSQQSWVWYLLTDGTLRFYWSTTGANSFNKISSVPVPFADGEEGYVAVTLDVDNGASGADVDFWTSTDGETWSQLGTTQLSGAVTSIYDSTAVVEVGSVLAGTALLLPGEFSFVEVISGDLDGTLVERIDAEDAPTNGTTWTSPTSGATITLNKSTSAQYHAAVVPAHTVVFQGDGVNDYMQVVGDDSITDFDPAVGLTYIADFSFGSGAGSSRRLMSTGASAQSGILRNSTLERVYGRAYDGSTAVQIGDNANNISYDTRTVFTAAFGDSDHESYVDGVSDEAASTAVGSFAAAGALTFFADPGGGGNIAADLYGAAVVRRRIDDAAAVTIATEGILA